MWRLRQLRITHYELRINETQIRSVVPDMARRLPYRDFYSSVHRGDDATDQSAFVHSGTYSRTVGSVVVHGQDKKGLVQGSAPNASNHPCGI